MDKRSLAFIALFSLGLVGINSAFHYWNAEQKKSYLLQKQAYEAQLQKRKRDQIQARIAPVKELELKLQGDALSLKTPGATLYLATNPPSKELDGRPLVSLEHDGSNLCALYLDPGSAASNLLLQASQAFMQAKEQQLTYLYLERGTVHTFAATCRSDRVESLLLPSEGGFDPSNSPTGLLLMRFDNHHLPVALAQRSGSQLQLRPFASFKAIEPLLKQLPSSVDPTQEQFFVLENEQLQLVISSKGGALAEINLAIGKKESDRIKEVESDRLLVQRTPESARFPLHEAWIADSKGALQPLSPQLGGYYPLLRRQPSSRSSSRPANLYALALVADQPEVSELNYKVVEMSERKLVLEARQLHRRIRRTYELSDQPQLSSYVFNAQLQIEGDRRGLWIGSGVPEMEVSGTTPSPVLKYRTTQKGKPDIATFDPPKATTYSNVTADWLCNGNAFFALLVDPLDSPLSQVKLELIDGQRLPSRLSLIDPQRHPASSLAGYQMLMPLPDSDEALHLRLFAGPLAEPVLKQLDAHYRRPGYDPSYRFCLSFTGWFSSILRPFTELMMALMNLFHAITHSWAAAIFLLTLSLRAMLYPLNSWSNRSMRAMQEISPKVKALQERYKNEPQKAQMELVALYRQHKVNPASGCLPVLIQIPFLFAMLHLFKTNFALRGASFIPGWIDDLAAPDVALEWSYSLPLIGHQLHLLPILLGGVMFLQSQMTSRTGQVLSETQRQQKAMGNVMTLAFTFMFYTLPAGLNLYWLTSSILGIAQQWWNQRVQSKPKR